MLFSHNLLSLFVVIVDMGIFEKIKSLFTRETVAGLRYGTSDSSVIVRGDESAMRIATVFRCVKLLSEIVASLPLRYLKKQDGVFVDDDNDRDGLNYLLNVEPDAHMSAFDFHRQIIINLLLDGNAYIVPFYDFDKKQISRLALCGRGTVAHDTLSDTYTVNDTENDICGTFDESEVIHIKGLTLRNYKRGVSVLTYARLTMSVAATGDKETQNRFANGGNVHGIVSNDSSRTGFGTYDDGEIRGAADDIDEAIRGGRRIIGVPGNVDFKQLSLSSADLQFLESRKFTVIEICRFFGVNPTFAYADTSTNYKSAEQANVAFMSQTLNPLMRNIEAEFLRKLVPRKLCHKYRIRFDRTDLYACDLEGLMKYRANRLQIGSTVNEVRAMDNLKPIPDGDVALVSANLKTVNSIKETNEKDDGNSETE